MGKTISISNQKGGVGKTTTAVNLSACLAANGKKVLAVDIDPQGNMTSGFGIERAELTETVYELIIGETTLKKCIWKDVYKNLDVIPANINLSAAEIELIGVTDKEFIMREALEEIRKDYDYIIIDCPPSLNMLTVNALTASDSVLIPIQCEYYALEGVSQLLYTINLVRERLNGNLRLEGVVFTMYDSRTNLSAQVVQNVKENFKNYIFKTIIPRNIRLAEAPSFGVPINQYDRHSAGCEAYMHLAKEMIEKGGR